MRKVLLTTAMLFAGMLGFHSCTEEEPAEPTPNVGAQNPDNPGDDNKIDSDIDEEAAPEKLVAIKTGDEGTGCFSASFFDGGLFGMGRSFHINYPNKSVPSHCFTTKSRTQKEVPVEKGKGNESKIYYTKNDYEYNSLKNDKFSGGIGFLNVFQLDASIENTFKNSSSDVKERLVFVEVRDFGKYEYENDLLLTKDAYALLKDGNFDGFKNTYGTHYIYACEKMAKIFVTIERTKQSTSFSKDKSQGIGASGSYQGWSGYAEYNQSSSEFQIQSMSDINVSVDATDGIEITREDIENIIKSQLSGNGDYVQMVSGLIKDKINSLQPENAVNYKYYVAPFTQYGCEDIVWTTKKENKLTKINENYLKLKNLITMTKAYTSKNTADVIYLSENNVEPVFYKNLVDYSASQFGCNLSEKDRSELVSYYEEANLMTEWKTLQNEAKSLIMTLEDQFEKCNNISSDVSSFDNDYSDETDELIERYNNLYKIGSDNAFIIWWGCWAIRAEEESKYGTIELHNTASCNFNVEISGPDGYYKTLTMAGNAYERVKVPVGQYEIHTLQLDGFNHVFGWATEDYEYVTVQSLQTIPYNFNDHM